MMNGLIDRAGNFASDRAGKPVQMTEEDRSSSEGDVVSRREESHGMTMAGVLVTKFDVTGLAVDLRSLAAVTERRCGVRATLLDYGVRLSVELARNAVCNPTHRADERLSKWLLRQHDRPGTEPVHETVAGVAQILGLQRRQRAARWTPSVRPAQSKPHGDR